LARTTLLCYEGSKLDSQISKFCFFAVDFSGNNSRFTSGKFTRALLAHQSFYNKVDKMGKFEHTVLAQQSWFLINFQSKDFLRFPRK
jgi:hypothetical protein